MSIPRSLLCLVSLKWKLNLNPLTVIISVQSFSRDFGSPSETDYAVLQGTKARARQLILEWVRVDDLVTTEGPPATTEPVPAAAWLYWDFYWNKLTGWSEKIYSTFEFLNALSRSSASVASERPGLFTSVSSKWRAEDFLFQEKGF